MRVNTYIMRFFNSDHTYGGLKSVPFPMGFQPKLQPARTFTPLLRSKIMIDYILPPWFLFRFASDNSSSQAYRSRDSSPFARAAMNRVSDIIAGLRVGRFSWLGGFGCASDQLTKYH